MLIKSAILMKKVFLLNRKFKMSGTDKNTGVGPLSPSLRHFDEEEREMRSSLNLNIDSGFNFFW